MTNAEFRCFSGDRIIFANEVDYRIFQATDLNTNVLSALNITAAQLELKQQAVDAEKLKYQKEVAANQAEWERERQVAAQQAQLATQQAHQRAEAARAATSQYPGHGHLTENQQNGAY
jgi:hypothetical protein